MSKTILIVEDNHANLKLATTVLEHAGYKVLGTPSATEAIALAQTKSPKLILMDMQLPGMNGIEATRRLKAESRTASIPIIAITAFAMTGDEKRFLHAGCDDYIAKPFDYKDLLARVANIVGDSQEMTKT